MLGSENLYKLRINLSLVASIIASLISFTVCNETVETKKGFEKFNPKLGLSCVFILIISVNISLSIATLTEYIARSLINSSNILAIFK